MEIDRIYGFGANFAGQLGIPRQKLPQTSGAQPFLIVGKDAFDQVHGTGIPSMGTGGSHNVVLVETKKAQQITFCWGGEDGPQVPRMVGLLRHEKVVAVSCGGLDSLVVDAFGNCFEWGFNAVDKGAQSQPHNFKKMRIPYAVRSVASGGAHRLIRCEQDLLYVMGMNNHLQIKASGEQSFLKPEKSFKNSAKLVAAGGAFSLRLDENDILLSVGLNDKGQCGIDSTERRVPDWHAIHFPVQILVTKIGCGDKAAFAISSQGQLFMWGANASGQLGLGHNEDRNRPQPVLFEAPVLECAMGGAYGLGHSVLIASGARVYSCGSAKYHQTGHEQDVNTFQELVHLREKKARAVSCGWLHTFVLGKGTTEFPPLSQDDAYLGKLAILPQDVIVHHLLPLLDGQALCRLSQVNSIFNSFCSFDFLWKTALFRDYGVIATQTSSKNEYIREWRNHKTAFGANYQLERKSKALFYVPKIFPFFTKSITNRILMIGLDAAGKTTILYKLKLGEIVTTIPTIGFNVETVQYKSIIFTTWDVGGSCRLRALCRHYMQGMSGLIFVVDSNDRERIEEASDELNLFLLEDQARDVPVLVFANKGDLPNAMSVSDIAERMSLQDLKRPWYIQSSVAITGDGLYEGLDWLSTVLSNMYRE